MAMAKAMVMAMMLTIFGLWTNATILPTYDLTFPEAFPENWGAVNWAKRGPRAATYR